MLFFLLKYCGETNILGFSYVENRPTNIIHVVCALSLHDNDFMNGSSIQNSMWAGDDNLQFSTNIICDVWQWSLYTMSDEV